MANAKRDNNRVTALIGTDENGNIQRATVDGVTGYLNIKATENGSPSNSQTISKRDNNRVPTALGEDPSGIPRTIMLDGNRRLYVG